MTIERPGRDFDAEWDPDGWGTDSDWGDDAQPAGPAASDRRDERIQEGLDHVQRAAREMIAASRSLLDVAEELVEDPGTIVRLARLLGGAPWAAHRVAPDAGPDDEDPPVQRIPVS